MGAEKNCGIKQYKVIKLGGHAVNFLKKIKSFGEEGRQTPIGGPWGAWGEQCLPPKFLSDTYELESLFEKNNQIRKFRKISLKFS